MHACVSALGSVPQALQAMADRRNKIALPALATKYGFRLPPPDDCLIVPNFQLHPRNAPDIMDWEDESLPSGQTHNQTTHCGVTMLHCQDACQYMSWSTDWSWSAAYPGD